MKENTWPGGKRHAMRQDEHRHWNADNHPGTLQICALCEYPTGRCEEDEMLNENEEPICESCRNERWSCESCGLYIPGEHVTYEETHAPEKAVVAASVYNNGR